MTLRRQRGVSLPRVLMLYSLAPIVLLVVACATTDIASVQSPDYEDILFHSIVVLGTSGDIRIDKLIENEVASELEEQGVAAVKGSDLFPPVKEYSFDEMRETVETAEAILTVAVTGSGEGSSYVPGVASSTTTTYGYTSTTSTTFMGGGTISYPVMNFDAKLYQLDSGDIVWRASARTEGDEFSGERIVVRSLSEALVDQYLEDAQ